MFKEKYCIVTGAAGFLGEYHCKSVLETSNSLIMIDIDKKNLIRKKNVLEKKFSKKKIFTFRADISKETQIKNIAKKLKNKKILINSIINNAAIDAVPKKDLKNEFISSYQWKKELDVSLLGSYLIIKFFIDFLKKNKNSSVINIGSDLSVIAPNQNIYKKSFKNYIKPVTYSVAKHGLLGITKYYASLYANKNIRFNMISPGPIFKNQDKNLTNELKKLIPMNRLGNPKDLSEAIKFLLNEKSSFITGQNIIIDGGRTII